MSIESVASGVARSPRRRYAPAQVVEAPMRPAFFLALLTACSDTSLKVVATPPTADLLSPSEGDAFVQDRDTVTFYGQVGDEEQTPESLTVLWLSNRDGAISDLPADTAGTSMFELPAAALSVGAHVITLSVSDGDGLNDSDEVQIEIQPADAAPEVSVLSPADGADFDAGEAITFEGHAEDARTAASDLLYEWESDLYGLLDSGALSSDGGTTFTTDALAEGEHTLTLRVTDPDGYAGEASVSVVVNHVNEAPTAEIVSPENGAGARVGALVTFEGLVADPEDDASALYTRWESDLDGALCEGGADSSGSTTCSTSALSAGLHTVTLTAEDSAGATAFASIALEVYERNTPPGTPLIEISPADPRTTDALVVNILAEAEDEDGDAVSYNYQWYRDDALMSGYTADTVDAARTAKGEIWMVEVRATDGEDVGEAATAEVLILNTPPELSAATLSPDAPGTLDTITCTPEGWSDADDDPEGYTWAWEVDDEAVAGETGQTLAGAFAKNQRVRCVVTPWDGEEPGEPVRSDAVTVVNSPPEAPEISIDPGYPVTGDALVVVDLVAATDADGDALSTTYTWSKNGSVVSRYTTATVPASATTLEDSWEVQATVSDGDATATSEPVSVRIWPDAGDLIVTEIMPDPDVVSDQRGEWLEIYNTTSSEISLDDHTIEDLDYDIAALDGLSIGAGEHLVVCVEDDPTQNGGVSCDLEVRRPSYGTCSGTDCMLLGNSDDEVLIVNPALTVDEVQYTSAWVTAGRATGLDPDLYDHESNDEKASWCAQRSSLSAGDQGTPGSENDGC